MPFDLDGARKAGATDDQIADHLAQTLNFDIAGAKAKGATSSQIAEFLSKNERPKTTPPPDTRTTGQKIAGAVGPYARPVLETAGAIGGGIVGGGAGLAGGFAAPVTSPVGAAVGSGLGYAAGKSIADMIDEYAGTKKVPASLMQGVATAGKDAATGVALELGGQVAPKLLGALAKPVESVWGRLTGTGKAAIEGAIESGKSAGINPLATKTGFDKAMRGHTSGEDVAENAKSALQSLKEQRADAYQSELAEIQGIKPGSLAVPGQAGPPVQKVIDMKPIADKLVTLMRRYNVKVGQDGTLDLSRIAMGKAGRDDVKEIIEKVFGWGEKKGDDTVMGLDTLKRQLDDFYSDSSQARQFVESLKNSVKDTIVEAEPKYAEMTKGYEEVSKLIKDIESGLMLKKQGMTGRVTADMTLRRLLSSMKDNFGLRRDLVQVLGNKSGTDLEAQIAGYAMRSPVPLGLAGTGPALIGEAALAHLVNPAFWPVLAASSPRASGEFLRVFGKYLAESKGMAGNITKASVIGGKDAIAKKPYFDVGKGYKNPFADAQEGQQ